VVGVDAPDHVAVDGDAGPADALDDGTHRVIIPGRR
jgi:hypothetical protein